MLHAATNEVRKAKRHFEHKITITHQIRYLKMVVDMNSNRKNCIAQNLG